MLPSLSGLLTGTILSGGGGGDPVGDGPIKSIQLVILQITPGNTQDVVTFPVPVDMSQTILVDAGGYVDETVPTDALADWSLTANNEITMTRVGTTGNVIRFLQVVEFEAGTLTANQEYTVDLASPSTFQNGAISAVTLDRSGAILQGWKSDSTVREARAGSSGVCVSMSSGTIVQVRSVLNAGTGFKQTVRFRVIEFASGVAECQTVFYGATVAGIDSARPIGPTDPDQTMLLFGGSYGSFDRGAWSMRQTAANTITFDRVNSANQSSTGAVLVVEFLGAATFSGVQNGSTNFANSTNLTGTSSITAVPKHNAIVSYLGSSGYAVSAGATFYSEYWCKNDIDAGDNSVVNHERGVATDLINGHLSRYTVYERVNSL